MSFINFFRSTAPYIHAHRNKTVVVLVTGEAIHHSNALNIIPDLALMNSLGIRLVLVFGSETPADSMIGIQEPLHKQAMQDTLQKQGAIRSELEASFSMGLINSPMHNSSIRCISGNFVQARPIGVIDGIDMEYHGCVRNIDSDGISQSLDQRSVVLLPPSGYSTTGETFSLSAHEVAVTTASALQADKLLILSGSNFVNDTESLRELSLSQSDDLLTSLNQNSREYQDIHSAITATAKGVNRTHIIPIHTDGSLLTELFTRDGSGLMITSDIYDSVRPATIDDVGGILQLLEPLEDKGVLVKRSRELLEQEISQFVVNERDGMIIGCAALYPYSDDSAELGCVAVHPEYRHNNRGDALLKAVIQSAQTANLKKLFVLTTQTEHWFLERGFTASSVSSLPDQKKKLYNFQRNSKVFRLDLAK